MVNSTLELLEKSGSVRRTGRGIELRSTTRSAEKRLSDFIGNSLES